MIESRHTPGPWEWRGKSDTLHTLHNKGKYQYGKAVLSPTYEYDSGTSVEVSDHDANLIAASPDLYAACEWLVNLYHGVGKDGEEGSDEEFMDAIEAGKAALAKARGEAHE
jgi:hypothetical protein